MGLFSSINSKIENAANEIDRNQGLTDNVGSVWGKKARARSLTREEQREFNEAEERAGRGGKRGW